jgi:hypothetical protein
MRRLLLLPLLIIALAGCNTAKKGDVLFLDDFSNPDSGFQKHADADAITDYLDGQYQIEVLTPQLNVWSPNGPKLGDVHVEVNAHTEAGSQNNMYGLVCRYRDDKNFYFMAISADGYYAIGKVKENQDKKGEISLLSSKVYEPADQILTGNAVNHLTGVCQGSTLTLSANGSQLAQITDSDFSDGQVGLIAGTFDEPDTDVRFDDLVVTQP